MTTIQSEKLVTITTFTLPHEAHMAKNILRASGIKAVLRDELTVQVDNFLSNAIGGVKLQILESDGKEAEQILQEAGYLPKASKNANKKTAIIKIKSKKEKKKCPYCQSVNIARSREISQWSALFILFFSFFLPISKIHFHCFECEKNWYFKRV